MIRRGLITFLALLLFASGCGDSSDSPVPTPTPPAETRPPSPPPTSPPVTTPSHTTESPAVQVTALRIPALDIDAEVQDSLTIPDTTEPAPGCPARPAGQETLTVPTQGIATPVDVFDGLERTAWIFGHSRWQNQPGLLGRLDDIEVGDALFVDGIDRESGAPVADRRYAVEAIYLTDTDSGGALLAAENSAGPSVLLQTSVRERGADRPWLLDQEQVLSKASNRIEGDLHDPCKYLLLFVVARSS